MEVLPPDGMTIEEAGVTTLGNPTHYVVEPDGTVSRIDHPMMFSEDELATLDIRELPAWFFDHKPVERTRIFVDDAWQENVAGERDWLWAAVKVQREEMLLEPVDVPAFGPVDTKGDSRAIVSALANKPDDVYPIEFKFADNTTLACSKADMQIIDAALEQSRQTIRAAAELVRADIYDPAIITLAALYALDIDVRARV